MRRVVFVAGLIGTLTACGGSGGQVRPMGLQHSVPPASVAAAPATVREPDPDVRRGLRPEYTQVDCAIARCVALTFDDGPLPDTNRLLSILAQYRAKATFFLVGRMISENPDIVRKEITAGHEVANHSWSHANLAALSPDGVREEIGRTQRLIKESSGQDSVLFRPPYGSTNKRVAAIAEELGLPQIIWEVDPMDWKDRKASLIADRVLRQTRPGDIVLLHDVHSTTIDAVPEILSTLAKRGYSFVTVSRLLAGTSIKPGREYRQRPTS